jgi:hypothetical protein
MSRPLEPISIANSAVWAYLPQARSTILRVSFDFRALQPYADPLEFCGELEIDFLRSEAKAVVSFNLILANNSFAQ